MIDVMKGDKKYNFPDDLIAMQKRIIDMEKTAHERMDKIEIKFEALRDLYLDSHAEMEKRIENLVTRLNDVTSHQFK